MTIFHSRILNIFIVFSILGTLTGCSMQGSAVSSRKISELRPFAPVARTVELRISKAVYSETLKNLSLINKLRLVPILKAGDGVDLPEYRMFNILPGSVYELIGLLNSDVLIAANNYILNDPEKFKLYVQVLPREPQPYIEIRRGEEPIIFRIIWTDDA